jgi:RNA polymerase sigma-B factor
MRQTTQYALLREWAWLREELSPLVDPGSPEPFRVWSVGSVQDAVAVTAAISRHRDSYEGDIRTYLSGWRRDPSEVSFAFTDLESLSEADRAACFRRRDRRWVPRRDLADQVILGEPQGMVDLVTWRAQDPPLRLCWESVKARVRRGGHVLFAEPPAQVPVGLKPVGGPEHLLFESVPVALARPVGQLDDAVDMTSKNLLDAVGDTQTLGSYQMQQDLVADHLNLARSLARRFLHRGEPAEDLQQVAFLALTKAARRYDPTQQTAFSTFATVSILGELKRHFRDKTWMLRVPRSAQELYLTVKAAREELGHELGRSPTISEIAVHLGASEEAVLEAMEAGETYWPRSLDIRGDGGERIIDPPQEDAGLDLTIEREQLRSVLPHLDRREHLIFKRIFFDGETQRQVAEEIGVSQMQVSRLLSRALEKAREQMVADQVG